MEVCLVSKLVVGLSMQRDASLLYIYKQPYVFNFILFTALIKYFFHLPLGDCADLLISFFFSVAVSVTFAFLTETTAK